MKILVVDDHILVRDAITSLLAAEGFDVVGQASDGAEVLGKAEKLKPDLILMDVKMPGQGGLETTRQIKALMPHLKVVMLTASDDEQDIFEAIKSGADGYLLKDLQASELFESLRSLERGEAVIHHRLAGRILNEFRNLALSQQAPAGGNLTSRERDVLMRVADGQTGKEIARTLSISESAVKFHLRKILDKLHLNNRAQLVAWAVQHGVTLQNLT